MMFARLWRELKGRPWHWIGAFWVTLIPFMGVVLMTNLLTAVPLFDDVAFLLPIGFFCSVLTVVLGLLDEVGSD